LPGGERTWTVLGRDHVPDGPAEEYLEYLLVQRVSPNTVKSYVRARAAGPGGEPPSVITGQAQPVPAAQHRLHDPGAARVLLDL
jgi:hypothetical protein